MNKSDETRLWKRFATLDVQNKLEIIKTALLITDSRAEEIYNALIRELSKREALDRAARTWNTEKQKLVLEKLKTMRRTKRQKVLRYMDEIVALRQEAGAGWRKIAEYLRKTHRISINHETLRKYFGDVL